MQPHLTARRAHAGHPHPASRNGDAFPVPLGDDDAPLCADPLDHGADTAAWLAHVGQVSVRRRNQPEQQPDADGRWRHTHCVDCAVALPLARLHLGRIRCIDCQRRREHLASGRFILTDD